MNRLDLWIIIFGGMIITFAQRLSFITLLPVSRLPASIQRALRYVPPAILSAIVVPALMAPEGSLDITPGNHQLIAGGIAAIVAWRTRNTWLTIGVGLLAIWLLTFL